MIGNIDYALSMLKSSKTVNNAPTTAVSTTPAANVKTAPSPINYRSIYAQSQVIFTQPQFYSPLHTPQNWQIPSKRREIYQWLFIKPCEVITSDGTFKSIDELYFDKTNQIEDTVTGGIMFENINAEEIMSASGHFRSPCRFSLRHCDEKDAIEFKATGYWRSLFVSDEHLHIFMNGKKYRHRMKLNNCSEYRRNQGMPVHGSRHPDCFGSLIEKKPAKETCLDDYLLFPTPKVGNQHLSSEEGWLVGNCLADGVLSVDNLFYVRLTKDKSESKQISVIESLLEKRFNSTISSSKHGDGNGWRVSVSTKEARLFFGEYITGKRSSKKLTASAMSWDTETRLNVIAGYFDGDGSLTSGDKLVANNYSKDMADQLYAMILSVGIRCSLTRHPLYGDHYPTDSQWCYRLIIPSSDVCKLAPYMRGEKIPDNFEGKTERELRFFYEEDGVKYFAQPIEYIKHFKYTGTGFDLQIDPERAFVANGYISSNCRYFYENEPKVAAAIDFYSSFPLSGFETQCENSTVKRYFDSICKKLNIDYWAKMISKEYFLIGDAFPFLEVACEKCHGTNIDTDTHERCRHPGGAFRRLVVLNPDWIDVQANQFAQDPVITLLPDDELKRVVWQKQPKEIYDKLPPHIKQLIFSGRPIPLANESVSHIKHNPYGYGVYGTSLIRRLFKMLTYKDKLMTAQWIIAERLILPIRVVKVGNEERPAGPADIADVQQQLANVANDPNLTLVTHHAFDYDWFGSNGKVLQLSNEYDLINKEILQGLMINEALLSGEMSGYQSAAIGAETMIQRLESWRLELARWIEQRIFLPIAQMRGFIDKDASEEIKEPVWIYPKIKWNDLNIRDDTQQKQLWIQLHDKQVLSTQSLCEKFDLDYDHELERIRLESAAQMIGQQGGGAGGAGGGAGGVEMGGLFGGGGGGGGAEMGAPPEMGGAPPMGGGEMGGAAPPGMGADMGMPTAAGMGGTAGKMLAPGRKPNKSTSKAPEEQKTQPQLRLTSLEQIMYKLLMGMSLPFRKFAQLPMLNGKYKTDFAIPSLRLAIECDGDAWHGTPEAKARDKKRDMEMAQQGWTVLRFNELELKEKQPLVAKTVAEYVHRLWQAAIARQTEEHDSLQERKSAVDQILEKYSGKVLEAPDGQADQGPGNKVG